MSVLLLYPNRPRLTFGFMPGPYGLELLRHRLEAAGIESLILNPYLYDDPRAVLHEELTGQVTLVGLSVRNIDDALILSDGSGQDGTPQTVSAIDDVAQVLQWCREIAPSVPVVLGGAAVMHLPSVWSSQFGIPDRVVVENEHAFLERALAMSGGTGDGKPTPRTMTQPVRVRREQIYFRFRADAAVRSYAGCPLSCAHCVEHIGTRAVHRNAVEDVAEEVAFLGRSYPKLRRVFLADSEVNLVGETRTRAIIAAIRARPEAERLALTGYFNPRPLSRDLLSFLMQSRVHLSLTVDHVSDAVLARNGKNFRRHHLDELVGHYRDLGATLSFCLLLGQPGETRETVDDVLRFVDAIPDRICGKIYVSPGVRVYPETPLALGLANGTLDRRWLHGMEGLGNSRTPTPVYCESWGSQELLRYVTERSDGRIAPMNSYLAEMGQGTVAEARQSFEDFHVGLAEAARGKTVTARKRWKRIPADAPFLNGPQRREFLWQRGLLALQQEAPDEALCDWSALQRDLKAQNATGPGMQRLQHNIGLAQHLARV